MFSGLWGFLYPATFCNFFAQVGLVTIHSESPVGDMPTPVGNPVLRALDKAKTQTYHFKAILIAGMGFFTDSFDLFVISLLRKLLGRIYYYDPTSPNPGKLPMSKDFAIQGVALCGTLTGQLFFGWAGDKWGRKRVYGITLVMMVISSIGSGMSLKSTPNSVITTLCFFRFWLGFGIGGDYPLSATIMSEYSNIKARGAFVAAVFAMQGFGNLTGAAVTIILTAIFKLHNQRPPYKDTCTQGSPPSCLNYSNYSTASDADWVWRLVLMFGAIPAALTYYARSKMPETARYTALIERDQEQAVLDMEKVLRTQFSVASIPKPEFSVASFPKPESAKTKTTQFGLFSRRFARRHGLELFGTCLTWALLDVFFYSQQLLQNDVYTAVHWLPQPNEMNALEETYKLARAQAIIALAATVPGYWFTVFFIDKVGRKPIQLMGFFMISAFMYVLGIKFYDLRGELQGDKGGLVTQDKGGNHLAFIILYAFTFFFSNFGPNSTTFIIPAELFPARLRSTCNGISSAAGKAGAIVGTYGFYYASVDKKISPSHNHKVTGIGYKNSFIILASSQALGFIITLLCIPETKGRSLEDLSGEDEYNAVTHGDLGESEDNDGTDEYI